MLSFSPAPIFTSTWDNRPAVSSPLSSSPIRASSPLSPISQNAFATRQTQSSPVQPPKFKYATRTARPNPLLRKREEAQEARRKTFLQNVRQKADEKTWQRRDIEGQLLKSSLLAHRVQLSQGAPTLTDQEIDESLALEEEPITQVDDEQMMVDHLREEDELEAMIASFEETHTSQQQQPPSPSTSWTDDDFDDVPMDFLLPEHTQGREDHDMS
ncbi:hypothetical protein HJFPF1_01981 [Paramyrothecium foliicola]|nr:hypothetical protein HJFPF1_01981 [Paramyrothecium foliicola]